MRLEYHLDALGMAKVDDPVTEGVAADLTRNTGPIEPGPGRIDPALARPVTLTDQEFARLIGVYPGMGCWIPARPAGSLARLIPTSVPSGLSLHTFESTPPTP